MAVETIDYPALQQQAAAAGARVIAVSKRQPLSRVQALYDAGCRVLGENYVNGLQERAKQFPQAELHYIGPIQTRSLDKIIAHAHWIHSLSRAKEAAKASTIQAETGLRRKYLLQVNIGCEPQKNGILPDEVLPTWLELRRNFEDLDICGLMTIGPVRNHPADIHDDFARMQALQAQVARHDPACKELSMGMSHDWQIALEHNATMIRVGSLLFGPRESEGVSPTI